jgi:iron complex outermembrane receptor protein
MDAWCSGLNTKCVNRRTTLVRALTPPFARIIIRNNECKMHYEVFVMPNGWLYLIAPVTVGFAFTGLPVRAQNTGSGQTAAQVGVLDEVVVTATKRSENVQTIPTSVTAISGADLERRGIEDIQSLALEVPNLTFGSHLGASYVVIRGVGASVDSGITEPSVATYIDGIALPRSTMGFLQEIDLDRVEVLNGPQGTLYGRNSTGGAVNFVSREPTKDFEGGANLSTGSRDAFGASSYISGPLASDVYARLSGGYREQDGYVLVLPSGRHIGNTETSYLRGALLIEPTDSLKIDVFAKYEADHGANAFYQLLSPTTAIVPPGTVETTQPNVVGADTGLSQKNDTLILGGTVNWGISADVSARSISGFIKHTSCADGDIDATDYPLFNTFGYCRPSKSFSQEFDFFGDAGPLKWLGGAYYFHEDFDATLPVALPNGLPGALPPGASLQQQLGQTIRSYALFTDLTWSLTDRLRLNAGLRWNDESQNFLWTSGVTIPGTGFIGTTNVPSSLTTRKVLPKLGMQFDLSANLHAYAQWQQGFTSGGHQLSLPSLYAPETINSYEVGLKSQWLDKTLTANFSVFHYIYSNLQITSLLPPATEQILNGDAHATGVEVQTIWNINQYVRVNANATWLHTAYTNFSSIDSSQPELGLQNLDGRSLVRSPPHTENVAVEWRIPIAPGPIRDVTLRGEVFHSGTVVLDYFALPADSQAPYTTVNVSAIFTDKSDKTNLRLFVNNVGSVLVKEDIEYNSSFGAYVGRYEEPRTWGIAIERKF